MVPQQLVGVERLVAERAALWTILLLVAENGGGAARHTGVAKWVLG